MQQSLLTAVFLPIALGVIMLGLGLGLTVADFKRVVVYPRAVLVGLGCQMLLLPVVCVGLAHLFGLPPELAVGLVVLAAAPGGPTANLYSHLAKGDVALNITLTAVNSILCLFTLPFIVNWALVHFLGEGKVLPLVFDKVVQVFLLVMIPVAIGMAIRAWRPSLATRLDRPVRLLSAAFLLVVIVGTVLSVRARLGGFFRDVGLAALTFNVVSMVVGYNVPRLARLPRRQAIAIGMEIGIHNGTLAIAVASSPALLGNPTMAIPAAVYSILMFFTAGAFGWWVNRSPEPTSTQETSLVS